MLLSQYLMSRLVKIEGAICCIYS